MPCLIGKWGQVSHILVIAPPQPELSLPEIHRQDEEQDVFQLEICRLLLALITAGEAVEMTQAAGEFHEDGFLRKKWAVQPVFGPASPLPILVFHTAVAQTDYPTPSIPDLNSFLKSLFLPLRLPREVAVLAIVYVERLIAAGTELRTCTWKPVLISCLLIASKTWEDVSAQNVDFKDVQKVYTLQGINKMERVLASQLQWRFFVSPEEYSDTFYALKHRQRTEQQRLVFKRTAPNLHD